MGLFSNRSPFAIIATSFTLDPWTGFYRLLIWQHGLENVARSPITGIGLADWTREWWMASDSVDAFWLVIMMRMGVVALVFLLLAITLLLVAVHNQRRGMTKAIRVLVIACTFSLIAISLSVCTVSYLNHTLRACNLETLVGASINRLTVRTLDRVRDTTSVDVRYRVPEAGR